MLFSARAQGILKYIVKIITRRSANWFEKESPGRGGNREGIFERPLADVRRANMMTGDIGETLTLAAERQISQRRSAAVSSVRIHAYSDTRSDRR